MQTAIPGKFATHAVAVGAVDLGVFVVVLLLTCADALGAGAVVYASAACTVVL